MTDTSSTAPGGAPASNVASEETRTLGMRVLYMILFGVVFWILCWVLGVTAVVQLAVRLVKGEALPELGRFGDGLARYAGQVVRYLTFATDTLPFPFSDWPETRAGVEPRDLSSL